MANINPTNTVHTAVTAKWVHGILCPQATPMRQGIGRDREAQTVSVLMAGPCVPTGNEPPGAAPTPSPSGSWPPLCTRRSRRGVAAAETTPLGQPAVCEPCLERLRKEVLGLEYPCPGIPLGLLRPQASALDRDGKCLPRGSCPWGWASSCKWLLCPDLGSQSSCPSCPLVLPSLSFYTCIAASPNLPTRWVRHMSPERLAKWKQPALRKEGKEGLTR